VDSPPSAPVPAATTEPYRPHHPVRIVTATALFDGHDAAINVMRRILQSSGAEVIHLGHNRSARQVVDCALQEDAQAIAITSYQGGHTEYLQYMHALLQQRGASVRIFAGGGGTILPHEIEALHDFGITRIYSPDDGRAMGLQGMIDDLLRRCDGPPGEAPSLDELRRLRERDPGVLARLITLAENAPERFEALRAELPPSGAADQRCPVLGVTGTGGSGKSSLVDELLRRFLADFPDKSIAVIAVDPSKRKTGGALLGDRIRMNCIDSPRVFMRSLATRQSNLALSKHMGEAIEICRRAEFDLIVLETSGIGQSGSEITEYCDVALYVMTAEYGAATQLEKIDMLDFADLVAINKFDKQGSDDALRDVRKQYRRNHSAWTRPDHDLPVVGTIASQFADPQTDDLYRRVLEALVAKSPRLALGRVSAPAPVARKHEIIPPHRTRYLAEIAELSDRTDASIREQVAIARDLYRLHGAVSILRGTPPENKPPRPEPVEGSDAPEARLLQCYAERYARLREDHRAALETWPEIVEQYRAPTIRFDVRGRTIEEPLRTETLSGNTIARVCVPSYLEWGDILRWQLAENLPGYYPFTAGVFPLKRRGEDPTRMFAGEGEPERTNRRFHYLSRGMAAKRLSTAFDSVTLYGEDPDLRPDIFGKIGNSGVSVATLDDAKKLYSGFDLAAPQTSVSMTINGPAPMVLAFFMNAAIDQQCERWLLSQGQRRAVEATIDATYAQTGLPRPRYEGDLPDGHDGLGLLLLGIRARDVLDPEAYARIAADTLKAVRGTVQADILKEDQAQNTCIFSTEFALRMMGDIQEFFAQHQIRNFYSVSISGYHIAEAGANPITQLAFTLANGFTFVEYYLARGMAIDDFAPNLSFFFSNGLDPEYSVIGRVARRIWAKAIKHRYGGNDRSQKLKYHIQTSGRSLHAQEIAFNDIRTTLQALTAIYDHCNSLHTNAYDEAITTPTEESVRRAVAIQLIITHELGLAKNENPLQGSFIIEELTDLVEAAVLREFRRISDRGGVLGAMERMYQRGKIQDESAIYESLKHSGARPIVGVNTFLDANGSPTVVPREVIRSTDDEKHRAIAARDAFAARHASAASPALERLQKAALEHKNTFAALMDAAQVCTLGQLSRSLYDVGGQYRRNM